MFKVSRKSEYALLAVQHMIRAPGDGLVSVAELAVAQRIPRDLLAKVLQGLKRAGILTAAKGVGGGYRLARPAEQIHFLDVVRPFEEQLGFVYCQGGRGDVCDRHEDCALRDPMVALSVYMLRQLEGLTMDMIANPAGMLLPTVPRLGPGPTQAVLAARRDASVSLSVDPSRRLQNG